MVCFLTTALLGIGMSTTYSGNYPIELRPGEIERLNIQAAAMAPDTEVMLDRIGVREGWSCLDIGCGPRGITDLLSRRVGASGRVVGLDMNAQFLQISLRKVSLKEADHIIGVTMQREGISEVVFKPNIGEGADLVPESDEPAAEPEQGES